MKITHENDSQYAMMLCVYKIGSRPCSEFDLQVLHRAVGEQYGKHIWEYDFTNVPRRRRAERFFNEHAIAYMFVNPTTLATNSLIHNDDIVLSF